MSEFSPITSTVRVKSLSSGNIYRIDAGEGITAFELKNTLRNSLPDEYNDDYGPRLQIGENQVNDDVLVLRDTEIDIHFSRYPTYIDHLLAQRTMKWQYIFKIITAILGSIFIAAFAQVSFYLPIDDKVPVTFQTLAVLLIATMLGPIFGFLSTGLYLAEGAAGAPFFADKSGGIGKLDGPTSGYLCGFLLTSLITGTLAKLGFDRKFHTSCIAMIFGNFAIYFVGVPVLATFIGWREAFTQGLLPFIPGDGLKIVLATIIIPLVWKLTAYVFNVRRHTVITYQEYCCGIKQIF